MEKNNTMKYQSTAYREIEAYPTVDNPKVSCTKEASCHVVFLLRPAPNQGSSLQ